MTLCDRLAIGMGNFSFLLLVLSFSVGGEPVRPSHTWVLVWQLPFSIEDVTLQVCHIIDEFFSGNNSKPF